MLICCSFKEFVDQTKRSDFEQDNGWQGLDEQDLYSQQEYEEYERQRREEIQRLVESGAVRLPLHVCFHMFCTLLLACLALFYLIIVLFAALSVIQKENDLQYFFTVC